MRNYGIGFCKKHIKALEGKETRMIRETGLGFDICSQEMLALRRLKSWLIKFTNEKQRGLMPSYNPMIHGE